MGELFFINQPCKAGTAWVGKGKMPVLYEPLSSRCLLNLLQLLKLRLRAVIFV